METLFIIGFIAFMLCWGFIYGSFKKRKKYEDEEAGIIDGHKIEDL